MRTRNHRHKIVFGAEAVARRPGVDVEDRRQAGNDEYRANKGLQTLFRLNKISPRGFSRKK